MGGSSPTLAALGVWTYSDSARKSKFYCVLVELSLCITCLPAPTFWGFLVHSDGRAKAEFQIFLKTASPLWFLLLASNDLSLTMMAGGGVDPRATIGACSRGFLALLPPEDLGWGPASYGVNQGLEW